LFKYEVFSEYLRDYLEVAPHNKESNGKYKLVAACLIAYACGLSFQKGKEVDRWIGEY